MAGEGTDTVILYRNAYTLDAHVENLTAKVTDGAIVSGNALNNIIKGGAGDDIIAGGRGTDQLWGMGGDDIFVYADISEGGDVIRDFTIGADRIDLRQLMIDSPETQISFNRTATGRVILADHDHAAQVLATLQGVKADHLTLGTDILL